MFMTLLAGFQVLLSRYSGQLDVVVGTDVANRNRLETEHLIGFFINQLVLRSDLSADPTFEQLLDSVRETTLSAYQHQDVPFEKLVEELQPERDLSRSPLFQVKMVLQNASAGQLQLAGLKLAGFDASAQSIKLAINLMLRDAGPVVTGSLKYAAELFDGRTARRLTGHLVRVLESASADPACRVLQLDMLSEAERAQILEQSSGGVCERSQWGSIHGMIEHQAGLRPEAVAVVYEQEQLTYGGLNERANRLARHLIGLGVGPELRVGLWMERGLEVITAIVGVLKAGAAYVPLDVEQPSERVAQVMEDSQCVAVVTQRSLRGRLPASWAMVVRDGWRRLEAAGLRGVNSRRATLIRRWRSRGWPT